MKHSLKQNFHHKFCYRPQYREISCKHLLVTRRRWYKKDLPIMHSCDLLRAKNAFTAVTCVMDCDGKVNWSMCFIIIAPWWRRYSCMHSRLWNYTEATEGSLKWSGWRLWRPPTLLITVVFSSSPLWCISAGQKHLSLTKCVSLTTFLWTECLDDCMGI
jgi:hypothetical protein